MSRSNVPNFKTRIDAALANPGLQIALDRNTDRRGPEHSLEFANARHQLGFVVANGAG